MREGFRERLHEIALSRFRVDDCMNVRSEIQVPITERLARYIKPMRAIVRDILERNALRVRFYACVARHFKQGAVNDMSGSVLNRLCVMARSSSSLFIFSLRVSDRPPECSSISRVMGSMAERGGYVVSVAVSGVRIELGSPSKRRISVA